MAHVATLGLINKSMNNSGKNSDDDDEFLAYDFYSTPGGKSLFKPSLGDDYQIGHFSQDHSTQTNRTELFPVKKLILATSDLIKEAGLLKRDVGFIRCSMQADFELKLKQKSLELYVRMNERLAAVEKIHADKIETIRSAYRQQLCDAIVQIHGFYNSDFKKKMKSQQIKSSTDDGKLKQLKATNASLEATIHSLMDRLAECEGRDRKVTFPPPVEVETHDDGKIDKNACDVFKEKMDVLQLKINLLEERLAAAEQTRLSLQKEIDRLNRLLADAQKRMDRLMNENTDLKILSSSGSDLLDQQKDEAMRRAMMQREGYDAVMKRLTDEKKALEDLLARERAAAEEWRKRMKECEELHKGDLDLAAEIERLKKELLAVTNAWKKKFAILQERALSSDYKQTWNKTTDCARRKSTGLLKDQRSICQRNLELMPFVVSAAGQTVDLCQDLFADRRWNCSTIQRAPNYLPDLIGGSREQAYAYALSAASLAQSVAKGCSAGLSSKCNCGPTPNEPPPGGFKWGGCGDDVRFGVIFSKWFTDTQFNRKKMSRNALMNMHNNGVGRKILADSTSTVCKCHGVSGSCSIKTCFKALPSMRIIGAVLQRRYTAAIEVNRLNSNRLDKIRSARRPKSVSTAPSKRVSDDDLIYYTISPDYCLPDESLGSLGTQGRECNKTHSGSSGCRSMCCGRGYTTEVIEQSHRCDCRYYWCCYVKCKTCTKTVHVHRCR